MVFLYAFKGDPQSAKTPLPDRHIPSEMVQLANGSEVDVLGWHRPQFESSWISAVYLSEGWTEIEIEGQYCEILIDEDYSYCGRNEDIEVEHREIFDHYTDIIFTFRSKSYMYCEIPHEVALRMLRAESIGSFYQNQIKGKYYCQS
ncbi:MAG: KTSC domain-containing protein [Roseibium sp.]|uniref:KTSC domain-containing protein n=1 Tax=Roseibium sp. TaxID=1936156 RepID=UPI001B1AA43B|nr:KTSC domain-containing protein [Roseibium sp.]MBO6893572.1 KTSC domain-containing protein [Roseibium sp.]